MTRAIVGKAWMVSASTSSVVLVRIARTASWIASVAEGPAMNAPKERPRAAVHHDGHVPRRPGHGSLRGVREGHRGLERIVPGRERRLQLKTHPGDLRVGVDGAGDGAIVRAGVVAQGDPNRHPTLVVGEMGVHLRASDVARHEDRVRDPQVRSHRERARRNVDPQGLEAQPRQRERAADGEQDRVALGHRPIGEVDGV